MEIALDRADHPHRRLTAAADRLKHFQLAAEIPAAAHQGPDVLATVHQRVFGRMDIVGFNENILRCHD